MNEGERDEATERRARAAKESLGMIRAWALPAVVATLVLAGLAMALRSGSVEADLASRIETRLAQSGQSWAVVSVSGRDVSVSGVAPSIEGQTAALAAIGDVWGIRRVRDETGLVPLIEPFVWTARRSGSAVRLDGYVPTEDLRRRLHELARLADPEIDIDDRTALARGADDSFEAASEFGLRVLANLAEGAASISGAAITLEGAAIDTLRYENALQIFNDAKPREVAVARAEILPPLAEPFIWSVEFDPGGALISGSTPTSELGEALAAETAAALGGIATDDRTSLASGAPQNFEALARHAIELAGRLAAGKVELNGPNISVSGQARSVDDFDAMLALMAEAPEGVRIEPGAVTPAVVRPYVWQATRSGPGVELAGFMPDEQARSEVVDEARRIFGADRVEDRMRIAAGAPTMDVIGAAKFGLDQLARLTGGAANITDRTYSITGTAASAPLFEELLAELDRTLPASLELGEAAIAPPFVTPFSLSIRRDTDRVVIGGHMPDRESRQAIREFAGRRLGGIEVAEATMLASGAPDGFREAAEAGIQAMSRLAGAELEIVDKSVRVSGKAPYAFAADRIEQQLAEALPEGFQVRAALSVDPPQAPLSAAECQSLLTAALAAGGIAFVEDNEAVAPDSEGLLDRLAAIVQRCPEAKIEIGGHTDSRGSTRRNRERSQQRADAVLNYLAEAGVVRERLRAVGYGEANPVAPNNTDEGRARNRRIEFKVEEP